MKKTQRTMLSVNLAIIAVIFLLNFFYQKNGFDFTLKCICSATFALLGVINLAYGLRVKPSDRKLFLAMSIGLWLAFLGDVLIGYSFIIGAATFALGHVSFVFAYCFVRPITKTDALISLALFVSSGAFLLFSPLLHFEVPVLRVVCIVYALIISTMLGKALGNFISERNALTGTVVLASALFFFSDLMLVLDRFVGRWNWTDHACMASYYPALCLLAFSMLLCADRQPKRY